MTRTVKSERVAMVAIGTLAGALLPRSASAHLVTTGLGPVYDGITHVLMSPDDLVPIIALALLAGLNGPAAGRSALFGLTGAWLVGGIFGVLTAAGRCFPLRQRPSHFSCLAASQLWIAACRHGSSRLWQWLLVCCTGG